MRNLLFLAVVAGAVLAALWWTWRDHGREATPAAQGGERPEPISAERLSPGGGGGERRSVRAGGPIPAGLVIRVVDEVGEPVPRVPVDAWQGGEVRSLGVTSVTGVMELAERPEAWTQVLATGPAGTTGTAWVRDEEAVVQVVVAAPASISGRVVIDVPENGGPGEGLLVLAVPQQLDYLKVQPDLDDLLRHPAVAKAMVDASSHFRLEPLSRDTEYSLMVGGEGFLQAGPPQQVVPGEPPVLLRVLHGHGMLVTLHDSSGDEAPVPPVFGSHMGVTPFVPKSLGAEPVGWDSVTARLSLPDVDRLMGSGARRLYLFGLSRVEHRFGPIQVRTRFPGYHDAAVQLFATPIADGLSEAVIALTEDTAGFGELLLTAEGAVPERQWGLPDPLGRLTLEDEAGLRWGLALRNDGAGGTIFTGIPWGRYRATFTYGHGFLPQPSLPDVVVSRDRAELHVACPPRGELELELRFAFGAHYEGVVIAHLGTSAPRFNTDGSVSLTGRNVMLLRPPYRIRFLAPIEHYVLVTTPAVDGLGEAVRIEPGKVTTARFRLLAPNPR